MGHLAQPSPNALSMDELCHRAGISRGTLHNYVRRGLIAKPDICRASTPGGRYRKVAYFPPSALERLTAVQRLKQDGHSVEMIAQRLAHKDHGVIPMPGAFRATPPTQKARRTLPEIPSAITQIGYPAYMLNRNWCIEWVSERAEQLFFGRPIAKIPAIEDRHFFKLLFTTATRELVTDFESFVKSHLPLIQGDLPIPKQNPLIASLDETTLNWLTHIWPGTDGPKMGHLDRQEETIRLRLAPVSRYQRIAVFFREGTLVCWIPAALNLEPMLDFLTGRQQVITDLLMHRLPALCSMAVLVADLQNSVKISADLPPEEYFELITEIWSRLEEPFRRYHGDMGKHIGDGVVRYFLAKPGNGSQHLLNALLCASTIRVCMASINASWKARKRWTNDLMLNIGLHEGREWFGYIPTYPTPEFTALGDTVNIAARLSSFSRNGALWVTKQFLSSLPLETQEATVYGIRRRTNEGEILIPKTYSRVSDMIDQESAKLSKFSDIATISVTEVLDINEQAMRQSLTGKPMPVGTQEAEDRTCRSEYVQTSPN